MSQLSGLASMSFWRFFTFEKGTVLYKIFTPPMDATVVVDSFRGGVPRRIAVERPLGLYLQKYLIYKFFISN